jgi:hypothetical protein
MRHIINPVHMTGSKVRCFMENQKMYRQMINAEQKNYISDITISIIL